MMNFSILQINNKIKIIWRKHLTKQTQPTWIYLCEQWQKEATTSVYSIAWKVKTINSVANSIVSIILLYPSDMLIMQLVILKKLTIEDVWEKEKVSLHCNRKTFWHVLIICFKIESKFFQITQQTKQLEYFKSQDLEICSLISQY